MSYFIFTKDNNQNNLYRIAENDTDKNSLSFHEKTSVVKTVSDVDYNKVKQNKATAYLENDIIVVNDISVNIPHENGLKATININIETCDYFLNNFDSNNSMRAAVSTYKSVLESFDTSTVTFPMDKSWETYCSENGIYYLNSLQIP